MVLREFDMLRLCHLTIECLLFTAPSFQLKRAYTDCMVDINFDNCNCLFFPVPKSIPRNTLNVNNKSNGAETE